MNRFVNDCSQAIMIVHEKVQGIESWDGVESSASLLPEALTAPYQGPLGN